MLTNQLEWQLPVCTVRLLILDPTRDPTSLLSSLTMATHYYTPPPQPPTPLQRVLGNCAC